MNTFKSSENNNDPESEVVEVTVVRETDQAYLFKRVCGGKQDWFPKSEVWFHERNSHSGIAQADIPNWLLDKNGW